MAQKFTSNQIDDANEIIENFLDNDKFLLYRNEYHKLLMCASIPEFMTPELIGLLRVKFLGKRLPFIAEADILLNNSLFRESGYELYIMHDDVRYALREQARRKIDIPSVAYVVYDYLNDHEEDPFTIPEDHRVYRISAMFFLDENYRNNAVQHLKQYISELQQNPKNAVYVVNEFARYVDLISQAEKELNSYKEIIIWAKQVLNNLDSGSDIRRVISLQIGNSTENENPSRGNVMPRKIFISYKKEPLSKSESRHLKDMLMREGYDVFLDVEQFGGGVNWQQVIYENIFNSDVLIVLLEPKTVDSEWVQREVDLARGAQISILPVRIGYKEFTDYDIRNVQEKLVLRDISYTLFISEEYAKSYLSSSEQINLQQNFNELLKSIEELAIQTRKKQIRFAREILTRYTRNPATFNSNYYTFTISNRSQQAVNLHLATGDMTQFKDVDVLVNSENDYAQMAHFFENHTVSSTLRRAGAYNTKRLFLDDRVQQELDDQVNKIYGKPPVPSSGVIVTSAGHPQSQLVQKGIRYIFHAITKRVDITSYPFRLEPNQDYEIISRCVTNCLNTAWRVSNGDIKIFGDNARFTHDIPSDPIKSIVFPIFGTGTGGLDVSEVIPPMIRAILSFVKNDNQTQITDIFICVYSHDNVLAVQRMMQKEFDQR